MTPIEIVQQYLLRMQTSDPSVADLFSTDAQLIGLGRRVVGKPAIADFYLSAQRDGQANPDPVSIVADGDRVFAELAIEIAGGTVLQVVDVFVIRDGLIESLTYYLADPGD